jgi:hypothetical protein
MAYLVVLCSSSGPGTFDYGAAEIISKMENPHWKP